MGEARNYGSPANGNMSHTTLQILPDVGLERLSCFIGPSMGLQETHLCSPIPFKRGFFLKRTYRSSYSTS